MVQLTKRKGPTLLAGNDHAASWSDTPLPNGDVFAFGPTDQSRGADGNPLAADPTDDPDTLNGTEDNDTIDGLGGNDIVNGLGGDDILYGSGGDDQLNGGDGFDQLTGGIGSDMLNGGTGDDYLVDDDPAGGGGNDQLLGGDGWDSILINRQGTSGATTVLLDGGAGPDVLTFSEFGYVSDATLIGGDGDDQISTFRGHSLDISAGAGADRVALNFLGAVTTVSLGAGRDVLALFSYDGQPPVGGSITVTDFETGDQGDRLELLNYFVTRLVNWDQATNPFGTGYLRLVQDGANTRVEIDSDGGGNSYTPLLILQNVTATALNVYNLGGYAGDGAAPTAATILGTPGLDLLWGTGGADLMKGFESQDEMLGGAGNDRLEGGDGNDLLYPQYGNDLVYGGAGVDNLVDQEGGNDELFGEADGDYLVILRKDAMALSSVLLDGGAGDDHLDFNALNRTDSASLIGGDGNDSLRMTGNGNMIADGGAGDDYFEINYSNGHADLTLGGGADEVWVGADFGFGTGLTITVNDFTAGETAASDRLTLSSYLSHRLLNWDDETNPFQSGHLRLQQVGADTLLQVDWDGPSGGAGFATLVTLRNVNATSLTAFNLGYAPDAGSFSPTGGDDNLAGTPNADTIDGLGGNDIINGLGGDDTLLGGAGNDQLFGGDGGDTLEGGDGNDALDGGAGLDTLEGDDGNDILTGIDGVGDWMFGGLGNDMLTATSGSFRMFGDNGGSASEDGNDQLTLVDGTSGSWLSGGGGDDVILVTGAGDNLVVTGDTGNDDITVQGFDRGNVGLGDGDDSLHIDSGYFVVNLSSGRDVITITSVGAGFMTIQNFNAGEAGDRLDLSIYGANPFGDGTLVMSQNGGTIIDHVASGMRYVIQNVAPVNLSIYNLGVPNPNYAPIGLTIDDAFADNPELAVGNELVGADGNDTIRGYGGDDRLFGGGGDDVLDGGLGLDALQGGTGNDFLDGGAGADTMTGGGGNDTYIVDNASDRVIEGAGEGTRDVIYARTSYTMAADIQAEVLSVVSQSGGTAIDLTGNAFYQELYGNADANFLDGGAGADSMKGFAGNDTYIVDNSGDDVIEVAGEGTRDVIYARTSYTMRAGLDVEVLSVISQSGGTAIDLTGNELYQELYGNTDANFLDGGAGADTMQGFAGNDTYVVDTASDIILEGANEGTRDAVYARASYTLAAGVGVEVLSVISVSGGVAIDLTGNELFQELYGNTDSNFLDGGAGADYLQGFTGNDNYIVDTQADVIVEGANEGARDAVIARASYALAAGVGIEVMTTISGGATTAINLTGNELAQEIYGNAGANVLNGGLGSDYLQGFGGADSFAFTTALGSGNIDTIADFVSGTDKIALSAAIFAGIGTPGAFNAAAFVAGTAAADADDRIIYNSATGQLFYDSDGTGGTAAVLFATLSGNPALVASDFQVI